MNHINLNIEWQNQKLPIVNGIIYSDGSLDWINVDYVGDKRKIQFGSRIHLDDLLSNNEVGFSNIIINKKTQSFYKKINVYCGEGSFGGDGFVVVETQNDLHIKWIAFFETANPFEKIDIIDNKVIAYNNLNEKWIFDINNLSNLIIENY